MDIGSQDYLDPTLALAAAQAKREMLALNAQAAQQVTQTPGPEITDTVSLTTVAKVAADSFTALMEQVTALPAPAEAAIQPATAAPTVIQAITGAQELASSGVGQAASLNSPLQLPDAQSALLQQATLAPLAAQMAATQGTLEGPEQAQRDVAATSALSPAGAFGNGQASNPNTYTLAPGAESYALMQKLLVPSIPPGSLDLLV